jgi:pilus assembly protein CpaF
VLSQIARCFDDATVTDVSVGPRTLAFRQFGTWRQQDSSQLDWLEHLDLEEFCIDLVESAGGRLDFRVPMATVVSGDFRAHAVLGSSFGSAPVLTVRKLGAALPFICSDPGTQIRYSKLIECMAARGSVLITGSAGSGKTTLLRSLLNSFANERVITIEDAAELQLNGPNSVSLLSRSANIEGQGEIGLSHLLAEALRMSPDRIAVGEVRGVELVTMLDALNTGHSGAGATLHSNSLESVARRLSAIGARAGIPERALALQVLDAFELVAFVGRDHRIEALGRFGLVDERLVVNAL